jgi:hypothetical protein
VGAAEVPVDVVAGGLVEVLVDVVLGVVVEVPVDVVLGVVVDVPVDVVLGAVVELPVELVPGAVVVPLGVVPGAVARFDEVGRVFGVVLCPGVDLGVVERVEGRALARCPRLPNDADGRVAVRELLARTR